MPSDMAAALMGRPLPKTFRDFNEAARNVDMTDFGQIMAHVLMTGLPPGTSSREVWQNATGLPMKGGPMDIGLIIIV